MAKRLAVIGAGPKAAALVARACVLRNHPGGERVPDLHVYESEKIGAAWNGEGHYSSGFVSLCTPGERDVGFPYADQWDDDGRIQSIASELYARFSWGAYLVATSRFASWVDRERDHPTHLRFADYLHWVFDQADHDIQRSTVQKIWWTKDKKWCVEHFASDDKKQQVVFDGVVLTGNGQPREVGGAAEVPDDFLLDAATFWEKRKRFTDTEKTFQVAVAGDGGSAGMIAAWLADRFAETRSSILCINPMGTLFPRGDGHAERRWFTNPQKWRDLSVSHRRKLIERTEAGVISMRNKRIIDRSPGIEYFTGYLRSVSMVGDDMVAPVIEYEGAQRYLPAVDCVVNATGFDSWDRLNLVDHPATRPLLRLAHNASDDAKKLLKTKREEVEVLVENDLSMPASAGFPPGLHVPSLAGIAQGPGMGNLGCLGLMADRILQAYQK